MNTYIGTKMIKAQPMNRADYNMYRGWGLSADENGGDAGYLIEYIGGGQGNHPDHEGYISWSPKEVFDREYRKTSGMTFGQAIEAMKAGYRVARAGWNGKGMWISIVGENNYIIYTTSHVDWQDPTEGECKGLLPWIGMKTADNKFVPWLASQTDMLADDWNVLSE